MVTHNLGMHWAGVFGHLPSLLSNCHSTLSPFAPKNYDETSKIATRLVAHCADPRNRSVPSQGGTLPIVLPFMLRFRPRAERSNRSLPTHNWTEFWSTFHNQLGSQYLIVEEPESLGSLPFAGTEGDRNAAIEWNRGLEV